MPKKIISIAGWYGLVAILLAYMLITFDVIVTKTYVYQLLNLTGAVGLGLVAWERRAMQPAILNFIWVLVAIIGLMQLLTR